MDANQLWTHMIKAMDVSAHNKTTWFDPVKSVQFDGKVLTVNAGSGFGAYWLQTHYIRGMSEALGVMIPGSTVRIVHKPMSVK